MTAVRLEVSGHQRAIWAPMVKVAARRATMSGVTDLQFDPSGVARRTLDEVAKQHGPSALDDSRLLAQLLPDLMAGAEREAALVSAAASAGVGRLLTERVSHGMPTDAAIRDVALVLSQRHAYDIRACDWIVAEYAQVLGVPQLSPSTVPVARSGGAGVEPRTNIQHPGTGSPAGTRYDPATTQHGVASATQDGTAVQRSPDHTSVDTGAPGGTPAPSRRRRTGLIVAVVVLLAGLAGVLAFTLGSAPAKTGADCLVGSWRSTSVLLRDGTVTRGGVTVTYKPGGTGDGSVSFTEALDDPKGGSATLTENFTFNYAATDSKITYTNVNGHSTTNGPDGPQSNPISSLGDEPYSCTGNTLHVDDPDIGSSQVYSRN